MADKVTRKRCARPGFIQLSFQSTFQKIRVCKKILWTLNEWTEEKMEVYGNNNNVESPVIKIKIGDITTKW